MTAASPQPEAGAGFTLVEQGRWTDGALMRLPRGEVRWVKGPLGWAGSIGGKPVATARRTRPEHPWLLRIEGFEFWQEPTRIIPRWHYTPVGVGAKIDEAKSRLETLLAAAPTLDQGIRP